jgi:hypothetical protein
MAAPHTTTAQMTMIPRRRACSIQPVVRAAIVAPGRHGRVEQPGALGARVVDADREHGEQRARHAEGHGHEVDGERAHERVVAAHVAQPVGDRAQHRRVLGGVGLRRLGRHHDHGPHHRQAARRVDGVGGADTEHADEHAADPRADDHRQLVEAEAQRDGRAQACGLDEVGQDGRAGHVLQCAEAASRPPST